jgi:hypothetical protein
MGLAKAAELNGYPGPAHVLELSAQLELTSEQKTKTEALFETMQSRAILLGKELVQEERALDRLFASRAVSSEPSKTYWLILDSCKAKYAKCT